MSERARVLLADDSMVVRAVIRGQLASEEHELIEASDGEEALARVRADAPDVVLLDVEMPGMTGYEVLEAMQADPASSHIPVVFLSGRVTADDVARGLKLGAHDYLRKPVEPGELIARLTAALRSKRLHDRLRQDNDHLRETASLDSLTGAMDIRGLQRCLHELSQQSRDNSSPVGAVLLDIEGLAAINDTYGWDGGDQVLRTISERITKCMDGDHVLGRCGPDELLVLMPGAGTEEVRRFADRLQYTVTDDPHVLDGNEITVEVAVGSASVADGDPAVLLASVQQAVLSKKGGTPTVDPASDMAPPPPPPPPPVADSTPAQEATPPASEPATPTPAATPAPAPAPEPAPASDRAALLEKIRERSAG